ncbi:GTP pyrophosphokinase YwaC [Oxobacter pfennigii]|uniref:GTP pyrophosphokinase YwaC n=1 Tax=Oxobacter pfennigii TaxID=36849 RepID=A0A0P8W955_9CLOT|nr:hypothetical protein [Oxobacter pfennigii]KPU45177.1 GTP pyrophosphokinase YwaC [Oxobacter pfennigii]
MPDSEVIKFIEDEISACKDDLKELLGLALSELKNINKIFLNDGDKLITERPVFRFKSAESIKEKMERKNIDINCFTDKLKDLIGIRVVCNDLYALEEVCNKLSDSHKIEIVEQKRCIEKADSDGYRGVHFIFKSKDAEKLSNKNLKGEIQIRTIAQHFWATFSHRDMYKTGNIILNRIKERSIMLSDTLYREDRELKLLKEEVRESYSGINLLSLSSLLSSMGIMINNDEKEEFIKLLQDEGLNNDDIFTLHSSLTENAKEFDEWGIYLFKTIINREPAVIEKLFIRAIANINGYYWPKRKVFEWVLSRKASAWSNILNSDNPRNLIILLEAFYYNSTDRYIFTMRSPDEITMWSFILDNRYTVKALKELELIEETFIENIEKRETAKAAFGKHVYKIKCTQKGEEIAVRCIKSIFSNEEHALYILGNIEKEDFPKDDVFNWGLPRSASSSFEIIELDEGPNFNEKDWWTEEIGYY